MFFAIMYDYALEYSILRSEVGRTRVSLPYITLLIVTLILTVYMAARTIIINDRIIGCERFSKPASSLKYLKAKSLGGRVERKGCFPLH